MYKDIVVPLDISDSESFNAVLPVVVDFIVSHKSKIHFVYIIPDFGMKLIEDYLPKHWITNQIERCEAQIKELVDRSLPNNLKDKIKAEFYIGRGTIYDEVINYSNNVKADLIIISAVRIQLKDYMLGSNSSKIVRHSTTSVLVVRQ